MNTLQTVLFVLGLGAVVVIGVWLFYVISNFGDYVFEVAGSENTSGSNAELVQADYRKGLWNQTDPGDESNNILPNLTDAKLKQSSFASLLDLE